MSDRNFSPWFTEILDYPADAPAVAFSAPALEDDDGVELIELPDPTPGSPAGTLGAYTRRGFDEGRDRGFREAVALACVAAEELIADRALGDVPPSVIRQVVAALSTQLSRRMPKTDAYLADGLGI